MSDVTVVAVAAVAAQAVSAVVAIRTFHSLARAAIRSAVAHTPQDLLLLEREAARDETIKKSKTEPVFPIGL